MNRGGEKERLWGGQSALPSAACMPRDGTGASICRLSPIFPFLPPVLPQILLHPFTDSAESSACIPWSPWCSCKICGTSMWETEWAPNYSLDWQLEAGQLVAEQMAAFKILGLPRARGLSPSRANSASYSHISSCRDTLDTLDKTFTSWGCAWLVCLQYVL